MARLFARGATRSVIGLPCPWSREVTVSIRINYLAIPMPKRCNIHSDGLTQCLATDLVMPRELSLLMTAITRGTCQKLSSSNRRLPGGDDRLLRRPWSETVIYEMHVRGFTMRHPLVADPLRGTYAGLATRPVIEYLQKL